MACGALSRGELPARQVGSDRLLPRRPCDARGRVEHLRRQRLRRVADRARCRRSGGKRRARVLLHRCALRRPTDRARPRHRGAVRPGRTRRDPRRHARGPAAAVIGLASGDAVVVHASLRAVGLDANDVIEALLEAVGPDGLVVMPTFTYANESFVPDLPGRTGTLAEVFRRRPDALRSAHPTYSVAAVGADAAELVDGHEQA